MGYRNNSSPTINAHLIYKIRLQGQKVLSETFRVDMRQKLSTSYFIVQTFSYSQNYLLIQTLPILTAWRNCCPHAKSGPVQSAGLGLILFLRVFFVITMTYGLFVPCGITGPSPSINSQAGKSQPHAHTLYLYNRCHGI